MHFQINITIFENIITLSQKTLIMKHKNKSTDLDLYLEIESIINNQNHTTKFKHLIKSTPNVKSIYTILDSKLKMCEDCLSVFISKKLSNTKNSINENYINDINLYSNKIVRLKQLLRYTSIYMNKLMYDYIFNLLLNNSKLNEVNKQKIANVSLNPKNSSKIVSHIQNEIYNTISFMNNTNQPENMSELYNLKLISNDIIKYINTLS